MTQQLTVEDLIIDIVRSAHICDLEEVARKCTDLTWNQVFLEVDRLSRNGKIKLTPSGRGAYTLTFLPLQEGRPDRRSLPS
jgi:hypothetical protein